MERDVLDIGTKNKTIQSFSRLVRSRHVREKSGSFPLEGYRLIQDAVDSGVQLRALMMTEKAMAQYGTTLHSGRTLLLTEQLAAEISDTEHPQGVFAIADMLPERNLYPKRGDRCMLLHCLQDPSNLGAILRTAEALGTNGLYLYQCCDLYNPKAVRSSMGALFRIPVQRVTDMDRFFDMCKEAEIPTCAAVVDRDAELLGTVSFEQGGCVLIGNEGNGLPRAVSDACIRRMTIPMAPESNSLNAAMAAGLFLWEMARMTKC